MSVDKTADKETHDMLFTPDSRSAEEQRQETLTDDQPERHPRSRAAIIALMSAPGHRRAPGSSRIIR